MTIAKRLVILLALPLMALVATGLLTRFQLARIEQRSRFVAESRIDALATIGNLSLSFAELRINVRDHALATNQEQRNVARAAFEQAEQEVSTLLNHYADKLVISGQGRRLLDEYQLVSHDWIAGAKQGMSLADKGQKEDAVALLHGSLPIMGNRLSKVSNEWGRNIQEMAIAAGQDALRAIEESRWRMLLGNASAILLTAVLGYLTFGRIVKPIRALESSVKAVAGGDYTQVVPFTDAADETGRLARSVEVLKRGAEAMDQQRWVKTNAARIMADLQGAKSLAEFGQRLVSGLMPILGGGVAGFYLFEEKPGRLKRIAGYGLSADTHFPGTFGLGEGLVGQCAKERATVRLNDLPPSYLQIGSGLGAAPPAQVVASPLLSKESLLGVLELATFRSLNSQEHLLVEELLPVVALSLEVLQRNLRTEDLLGQTQEQARQLEEQTEELTQSQEELLAQKEELLTQQQELKEQRQQLQASEERSRLILESSAEGIFGTDIEGRISFVNPAACRMLGYTAQELLGRPSHEAFHYKWPDGSEYPKEQCPMYAAYKDGKASRIDDEVLWRKDGIGIPVEYGATPILKDGAILGSVISFTDITVRKQAEAEQQRHAAELQHVNFLADSALDLTKAGYWHVPLDGSGWYNSSERAARIFGDPPTPDHRYTLAHWAEHVRLGDDAAAKVTAENFAAAVEGRIRVYDAVYAYKRPVDGRVVWIHALGHVVKDANGKPTDMYGVTQDITEFKLAEKELAYRLAFQQALIETIPYPMFIKDADTRFIGCNKAYEREFGTTRAFLNGKTVMELDYLPEAERRKFHQEDLTVISEAGRRSYELPIQYADGQTHTTLYSVDGFKLADGSPGGLIGLLVDISDQKRIAEELREAKAKAEEATEMKSLFLANMSHEIRTPMNAIIGLSHLALKTPLNPKQRDYVSKVHNAGTSLLAVINDILDFSKIEAGKLEIETTDFKLDEVISSVTTLTAQKAHEKGLEFLAHIQPDIPEHFLGDPLRLGQILTNFVNNAVKFTERGEIRLEIQLVERTGDKVQLKFAVRDTGIGMTKEQAARLFQPFTQADMSTTRKHGGTGLGLTICRRLVELMGGRIWLETEAGVGSTFFFTVWLGVGSETGSGKIVPERLARLRVLVVDDNPTAREILQEPLSTLAEQVDAVATGKEAITAIKQHDATDPYDIVFMDWRMPGMDGLQASRYIKSDETLRHQPAIVLVTAFGREEVREEAERLQLDGFLVKPVTKSMIVDTLVAVFAHAPDQAPSVEPGQPKARLLGARILLAEDNEINQQIAIELLEGEGAMIKVANNGLQAVEILSNGQQPPPFDVVLMDLQMPEMDGYQATTKIRADARFGSLPIIAMTAHATIEERQRCLAAGMNDHISKPIDPAMLFDTLGRFFKPTQAHVSGDALAAGNGTAEEKTVHDLPPVPDLTSIPGLDFKDGLSRVAGNRKLYSRLLHQFIEQQGPSVSQISAALANGDAALAERVAHTLKGVAGNIGARAVQNAAGELETLLRNRVAPSELEPAKTKVSAVLDPLLAQLRAALAPKEPPAPAAPESAPPADPAQVRAAGEQLLRFLAEFDPTAVDFLDINAPAIRGLFAGDSWQAFQNQVQAYAFADAKAQLELALKTLPAA